MNIIFFENANLRWSHKLLISLYKETLRMAGHTIQSYNQSSTYNYQDDIAIFIYNEITNLLDINYKRFNKRAVFVLLENNNHKQTIDGIINEKVIVPNQFIAEKIYSKWINGDNIYSNIQIIPPAFINFPINNGGLTPKNRKYRIGTIIDTIDMISGIDKILKAYYAEFDIDKFDIELSIMRTDSNINIGDIINSILESYIYKQDKIPFFRVLNLQDNYIQFIKSCDLFISTPYSESFDVNAFIAYKNGIPIIGPSGNHILNSKVTYLWNDDYIKYDGKDGFHISTVVDTAVSTYFIPKNEGIFGNDFWFIPNIKSIRLAMRTWTEQIRKFTSLKRPIRYDDPIIHSRRIIDFIEG